METIFRWFLLLSLFACSSKTEITEGKNVSSNSQTATEVKTYIAGVKPFEYLIATTGTVEAVSDVSVPSFAEGSIKQILVKNSAYVFAGDSLLVLNNESHLLKLRRAGMLLRQRQIEYESEMLGYENVSDARKADIQANLKISTGLSDAEISHEEALLEFSNTYIRAPISGIISDLEGVQGSVVRINQVLCKIHDNARMRIVCPVLEGEALRIKEGVQAKVTLISSASEYFEARVDQINPRVDERTNQVKVILTLSNAKALLPGMHVSVAIRVPMTTNIIVPKEAIVVRSGKQVVFTVEQERAKWNYVTTGNENGSEIEILTGLKKGDPVIITNNLQLSNDAIVSAN